MSSIKTSKSKNVVKSNIVNSREIEIKRFENGLADCIAMLDKNKQKAA